MKIAGIALELPESTPEREALRDAVWAAWDRYVWAPNERISKARRKDYHEARAKLDEYDRTEHTNAGG